MTDPKATQAETHQKDNSKPAKTHSIQVLAQWAPIYLIPYEWHSKWLSALGCFLKETPGVLRSQVCQGEETTWENTINSLSLTVRLQSPPFCAAHTLLAMKGIPLQFPGCCLRSNSQLGPWVCCLLSVHNVTINMY